MKKPADNANAPAPHLKTNKHIREDGAAFIAAYTRACAALRKLDGVVGVGFGRKEKGGRFTGNLAIEVFVRAKKALHAVAPEHRVPTTFEGYRTDVRVVPSIRPNLLCDDDTMYPTVQGGVQIEAMPKGSVGLGLGTLGCVVRKRRKGDGDDNVYLLTNHHVLFGKGTLPAVPPISVYQPYAPPVAAGLKTQFVGMVEERSFNEQVGHTASDGIERPCYIDCAVARIDLGSTCFGKSCPNNDRVKFDPAIMQLRTLDPDDNRVTGVRDVIIDHLIALPPGQDYPDPPIPPQGPPPDLSLATDENRVYKVGRTSAKTTGIVICVNAVAQTGPVSVLEGIIEIAFDPASTLNGQNCKGNAIFGEDGDSGSLILDKNNKAIGLLFAGRKTTPNEHSTHMTYACHIVPVLDKLNICIATKKSDGTYGSTDPGTDGATDGTGLATAATPEQLTAPASGGGAVFASYERSAPPRIRPPDIALGATVD
ncbi:MAG TPA: hypothetical protein VMT89_14050, partial [Candidatus Acidoferrales bacterium]|nr:hypothetical protein [Candidatus Acidoferrales bacterium]